MKISDFKRLYNPHTRCFIKTKVRKNSFSISGLIIDVQGDINSKTAVYIDNFYNRISIADIDSMTVTKSNW